MVNDVSAPSGVNSTLQAMNYVPTPSSVEKEFFDFHSFFNSFSGFITILWYTLILPLSQLQKQQLMTSNIVSHVECLINT